MEEPHKPNDPLPDFLALSKDASIFQNSQAPTDSLASLSAPTFSTLHSQSINYLPPPSDAHHRYAQAIISGYQLFHQGTIRYNFYDPNHLGLVSEATQQNFRKAFNSIEHNIPIKFVEVSAFNDAEIRISLDNNTKYAAAHFPFNASGAGIASDIFLNPEYDEPYISTGFQSNPGNHGFMTLIHEIGHALGLKHPHQKQTEIESAVHNLSNTVMSYHFTGSSPATLMPFDLIALQSIYGKANFHEDDTLYEFLNPLALYIDGELFLNESSSPFKATLWDSGGHDTVDLSKMPLNTLGYIIDLNPGGLIIEKNALKSDHFDYGYRLAFNVCLEDVINSSSDDDIFLNNASNIISGYSPNKKTGFDVIHNHQSQDVLDLTAFSSKSVIYNQENNDLILSLNENSHVLLTDYLASAEHIQIMFEDMVMI